MNKLEQALAEADDIEAAGHTADPDTPLPKYVRVGQPGRTRSKVLQVRLNAEEMAALETIAKGRELPVSTVAREQILRLIASERDEPADKLCQLVEAAERVKEFADDLRRQLPHADMSHRRV